MHHIELETSSGDGPEGESPASGKPWYRELTRYHWFVLLVAALGWLFDCLDQQLFVLTRPAAMRDLLPKVGEDQSAGTAWRRLANFGLPQPANAREVDQLVKNGSDYATSAFLAGWALGGLLFGMLGDRIGRARVMLITIVLYSAFTGLSSLSQGCWDFCLFRLLTGLGVGGEFAVGVALVAEVMPSRARPFALTMLQMLSALGNITAALINMGFGLAQIKGSWRYMFLIGALPALLALLIRSKLKEPEKWRLAKEERRTQKQLGSYRQLFGNAVWRRHALAGMVLASAGVIGLWAIGFYAPDLTDFVLRSSVVADVYQKEIEAANVLGDHGRSQKIAELLRVVQAAEEAKSRLAVPGAIPEELRGYQAELQPVVDGRLTVLRGISSVATQVGAFLGMFGFGWLASRIGRKPTFVVASILAFLSTATVFWCLTEFSQIFWMLPIMGFCQLSLFAGYAIYFPELFPTSLRSTGTSFCYNVGRIIAAFGPLVKTMLTRAFSETPEPMRYAGVSMCGVFLLALIALAFLPETRGKPLPE